MNAKFGFRSAKHLKMRGDLSGVAHVKQRPVLCGSQLLKD